MSALAGPGGGGDLYEVQGPAGTSAQQGGALYEVTADATGPAPLSVRILRGGTGAGGVSERADAATEVMYDVMGAPAAGTGTGTGGGRAAVEVMYDEMPSPSALGGAGVLLTPEYDSAEGLAQGGPGHTYEKVTPGAGPGGTPLYATAEQQANPLGTADYATAEEAARMLGLGGAGSGGGAQYETTPANVLGGGGGGGGATSGQVVYTSSPLSPEYDSGPAVIRDAYATVSRPASTARPSDGASDEYLDVADNSDGSDIDL